MKNVSCIQRMTKTVITKITKTQLKFSDLAFTDYRVPKKMFCGCLWQNSIFITKTVWYTKRTVNGSTYIEVVSPQLSSVWYDFILFIAAFYHESFQMLFKVAFAVNSYFFQNHQNHCYWNYLFLLCLSTPSA